MQLGLYFDISPKHVFASPFLMEVLISNLLSNVLSYTEQGAKVSVKLDKDQFVFINEGEPLGFPDKAHVFGIRFDT